MFDPLEELDGVNKKALDDAENSLVEDMAKTKTRITSTN